MDNYLINTLCGQIQGSEGENGCAVFKGIRYATTGRWEYPKITESWDGIYDATKFASTCWQDESFIPQEKLDNVFYYHEFRKGIKFTFSEDCQFLNIWIPKDAANAPVLFYIHGGGFTKGCGHQKPFDGSEWSKRGVILVTINYRIGPLGFLCLPELAEESGHTGNYGLYDQITALQWVRNNISSFGGDPDNITIMGQSAGAISVMAMSASPLTKGMFAHAIAISGGGVNNLIDYSYTAKQAYPFWEAYKESLGGSLDAMRSMPAEDLFKGLEKLKNSKGRMKSFGPIVDGDYLPMSVGQAAKKGLQHNIPYITSATSEDMMPPLIFGAAKSWAVLQESDNKSPSYVYYFSRQLPGDDKGAWHSSDLWYVFGQLSVCWRPFTQWDYQLSKKIMNYLENFIRTGNPNGSNMPTWLPTGNKQKKVMRFSDKGAQMGKVSFFEMAKRTIKALGLYDGGSIK